MRRVWVWVSFGVAALVGATAIVWWHSGEPEAATFAAILAVVLAGTGPITSWFPTKSRQSANTGPISPSVPVKADSATSRSVPAGKAQQLHSDQRRPDRYDVFVSHAIEDHDVAAELSSALQRAGLSVWFSGLELLPGDPIRRSLDRAIVSSRYGIVILSPNFFKLKKYWTQYELDGLIRREIDGRKVILPIWLDIDEPELSAVSPSIADRVGIQWSHGLNIVVRDVLRVVRPVAKSQRRAALERRLFDRMYHYEDATAAAIRLVGAGSDYFAARDVSVGTTTKPYSIPSKHRSRRSILESLLMDEAQLQHKVLFDGPEVRMVSYRILVPNPDTERKTLHAVFGPLRYFDYAITRRLSDAAMEDDGQDNLDEFVDVDRLAAGEDLSVSSLSNIVDTATTIVTHDGHLLYVERGSQVSDRGRWHTCAVAEGIQAAKDGVHFGHNDEEELLGVPFRTVLRGIEEELSPQLRDVVSSGGMEDHLRLLGLSYDLEGFHPDLLFLLVVPLSLADVRKMCREFPGTDSGIEGALRSTDISDGPHDIVRTLTTTRWTPGGAASVVRTLEHLTAVARDTRRGSLGEAIQLILSQQERSSH